MAQQTIKQLEGTLVYVMLNKPTKCFDKDKGEEWKAGILLTDEDEVDAFDEAYPKQSAKKIRATEFESTYKCEVPEGAGKNVWVITLKKNTKLSNGNEVPDKYKPRVFEVLDDGTKLDVTLTKLPANGSKGIITIDHYDGDDSKNGFGDAARLKNVFVTEMIEYEGGEEYEPGSEVDLGARGKKAAKPAKVEKNEAVDEKVAPKTTKRAPKVTKTEESDGDDPF